MYQLVDPKLIEAGLNTYKNYENASHVLLYALTDKVTKEKYPRKAIVLMQMRFDGYLGFPGGLVDEGEIPADAVNRELYEEIHYNSSVGKITQSDFLFAHLNETNKGIYHFYAKELTEVQIEEVIRDSVNAEDFGDESLGSVLVPLYTMTGSSRGLPTFLRNQFVGNALAQLTMALVQLNILTEDELQQALSCPL